MVDIVFHPEKEARTQHLLGGSLCQTGEVNSMGSPGLVVRFLMSVMLWPLKQIAVEPLVGKSVEMRRFGLHGLSPTARRWYQPAGLQTTEELGPSEPIRFVSMHERITLVSPHVDLERVAINPDLFVLRNFLPQEADRSLLIELGKQSGLQSAETKSGKSSHRTNSSVAFLPNKTNDIVKFMSDFAHRFVHDRIHSLCEPENLQVAKYTTGGKFDLHHDGRGRVVTVLTYLNGVADTWFPFANVDDSNGVERDEDPPEKVLEKGATVGKEPGSDGVWFVGEENQTADTSSPHTVRIHPGDSIVFFNYVYDSRFDCPVMNWRALHAGRPAKREKWIATNWIASGLCATPEKYRRDC